MDAIHHKDCEFPEIHFGVDNIHIPQCERPWRAEGFSVRSKGVILLYQCLGKLSETPSLFRNNEVEVGCNGTQARCRVSKPTTNKKWLPAPAFAEKDTSQYISVKERAIEAVYPAQEIHQGRTVMVGIRDHQRARVAMWTCFMYQVTGAEENLEA